MSHYFFLQNVPFGNFFAYLVTFSFILPVRETFYFIKVSCTFMPVDVTCLHRFLLYNHGVTALFFKSGFTFYARCGGVSGGS